jgi:hypothetical protein
MHCFRVGESTKRGLLVQTGRDAEGWLYPYIPTPAGCSMKLMLDEELTRIINDAPATLLRLSEAELKFGDGVLLFKSAPKRHDKQALLRVETAAGTGGVARLTSGSYTSTLVGGEAPRVYPRYHPFPDAGVLSFCTKEELQRVNRGVDFLDVIMLMHQGARCRIQRTGQLDGASPWMDLRWTGDRLIRKYEGGEERTSGLVGAPERHAGLRAPFTGAALAG